MPRVGGAWLPAWDPTRRIGINWGNDVANAHFGVRYLLPADILRCNHRVSGIIEDFYKCISCNGSFFLIHSSTVNYYLEPKKYVVDFDFYSPHILSGDYCIDCMYNTKLLRLT